MLARFDKLGKDVVPGITALGMKFKMVSLAKTIVGHSKDVTACSFSPNSQILASSSGDKTVRLWNIPDGEEVSFSPLLGHLYSVNACCFSPFGTLIATGSTDCNVYLWDAKTGKAIAVLEGHKGGIRVCCFSPNSRYLLSGSGDETFCIWDVTSRKLVRCVEKLESTVMACVFTPDNLHIITGTSVGDLSIWEAQKGKLRRVVEGHDLGVSSCSFSATFGSAGMPLFYVCDDEFVLFTGFVFFCEDWQCQIITLHLTFQLLPMLPHHLFKYFVIFHNHTF